MPWYQATLWKPTKQLLFLLISFLIPVERKENDWSPPPTPAFPALLASCGDEANMTPSIPPQVKKTALFSAMVVPPSTLRQWFNICVVNGQSMAVIGSFFYVPYIIIYLQRKMKTTRHRALAMFSLITLLLCPVQKSTWIQRLFVWDEYDRYFQTKVVGTAFSSEQSGTYPISNHSH